MPKMLSAKQPGAPVFKEGGWADCDGKPSMTLWVGWVVSIFLFHIISKSKGAIGPATLLNRRSKRSNSFSFLWSNSLVSQSNMLKYFSRELVFSPWICTFGKFRCREGWHYAFWQSSQTVKFPYILMNAILGPTLLIHTSLVPESWIFQFTRNFA